MKENYEENSHFSQSRHAGVEVHLCSSELQDIGHPVEGKRLEASQAAGVAIVPRAVYEVLL